MLCNLFLQTRLRAMAASQNLKMETWTLLGKRPLDGPLAMAIYYIHSYMLWAISMLCVFMRKSSSFWLNFLGVNMVV